VPTILLINSAYRKASFSGPERNERKLGAPIQYCPTRKAIFYESEGRLTIDFMNEGQSIKGGKKYV